MLPDVSKVGEASSQVFGMIDRKSLIDPSSPDGNNVEFPQGKIEFDNLHFSYPTAPDLPVLRDVKFQVLPGQTVALVGESGCGKSTILALMLRFYNLTGGSIKIDGHDISDMNVFALRSQIGYVSQEPKLFDLTIEENIRVGKPTASDDEVIQAAKSANVHEWIDSLPNKYKTPVGVQGGKLSGGQKQRIAIARALIRNPKALVLDEATSALDAESERIVQDALDVLMADKERTIIVIAHRLSTIKNADNIVVIDKGRLKEQGTHNSLMRQKGLYATFVGAGNEATKRGKDNNDNDNDQQAKKKKKDNKVISG